MNTETVAIDSIQPDPANVRKHPTKNLDAIKGSLARFGQQRPIVVDDRGIVLAGNGTLAAAKELGWPTIEVIRTTLTGSEATAFAIADNRSSETSEWDQAGLASILSALNAEDQNLFASTGFTPDELAGLLGQDQDAEPAQPPDQFNEFGDDIDTEHECPRCKFRWSGTSAPLGAA